MFVDISGYTKRTSLTTREKFIHLLDTYKSIVEPVFSEYKGRIVKEIGDACLVVFESPTNSVLCGIELQNKVAEHNRSANFKDRFHIKVAINAGEVHLKDNDIYGEPVNIASRLEKMTPPGKIYFTEAVFLAMNKNEAPVQYIGDKKIKGLPRKLGIYSVLRKYDISKIKKKKRENKRKKEFKKLITFIILIISLVIALTILFLYFPNIKLF